MISLVEQWAVQIQWPIAQTNIIVEGTSDVALLTFAARQYGAVHGKDLFEGGLALIASGHRDDGGVDGVNRRLNVARQLSEADRDQFGSVKHRFVGLFDNDRAGRIAIDAACEFDRRLIKYHDLFLLHPVMPIVANAHSSVIEKELLHANLLYKGLDWEVEDLCSEAVLSRFEMSNPQAVKRKNTINGLIHRKFDSRAKPILKRDFLNSANLNDCQKMIAMFKAMRSYLGLSHAFIA